MALPVWEKGWEMSINNAVGGSGVIATDYRLLYLNLIQKLLDGVTFSTPAICWGSCDGSGGAGSFGNNDGVQRITDITKIVGAAAPTKHSWIVYRLPGMGGNASLCIDFNNGNLYTVAIILSPLAGFGSLAAGTDTARPTATDEIVTYAALTIGPNATFTGKNHLWMSSDGQCIRFFHCRGGTTYATLIIEKGKDPIAQWTAAGPVWIYAVGNQVGCPTLNGMVKGNFYLQARMNASTYTLAPGYEEVQGTVPIEYWGSILLNPMEVPAAEYPTQQMIGLWCWTTPVRGRWGSCYDMYFGPVGTFVTGDSMPSDGSNQAYMLGGMVMPGNGTALQVA